MLPLFAHAIDVIGMVVAVSPLEKTKMKGTAKREVLLCDMQDVFLFLLFFLFLMNEYLSSKISACNAYT